MDYPVQIHILSYQKLSQSTLMLSSRNRLLPSLFPKFNRGCVIINSQAAQHHARGSLRSD